MDAATGRIAALGNGTAPVGASGDDATDLMGAVVVPGMIDAHLHVVMGGLSLNALNLGPARSLRDLARRLEVYRESWPASESEWLVALDPTPCRPPSSGQTGRVRDRLTVYR